MHQTINSFPQILGINCTAYSLRVVLLLALAITERYILYCKLETVFQTEEGVWHHYVSALRHAAFNFFKSKVNQGFDFLTILVVKGACLSNRTE